MTARDYFNAQLSAEDPSVVKPTNNKYEFGGVFGGPIVQDKAHFFVSLERRLTNPARTYRFNSRPDLDYSRPEKWRAWNTMYRVDHQINGNNSWALRFMRELSPETDRFSGRTLTSGTTKRTTSRSGSGATPASSGQRRQHRAGHPQLRECCRGLSLLVRAGRARDPRRADAELVSRLPSRQLLGRGYAVGRRPPGRRARLPTSSTWTCGSGGGLVRRRGTRSTSTWTSSTCSTEPTSTRLWFAVDIRRTDSDAKRGRARLYLAGHPNV